MVRGIDASDALAQEEGETKRSCRSHSGHGWPEARVIVLVASSSVLTPFTLPLVAVRLLKRGAWSWDSILLNNSSGFHRCGVNF